MPSADWKKLPCPQQEYDALTGNDSDGKQHVADNHGPQDTRQLSAELCKVFRSPWWNYLVLLKKYRTFIQSYMLGHQEVFAWAKKLATGALRAVLEPTSDGSFSIPSVILRDRDARIAQMNAQRVAERKSAEDRHNNAVNDQLQAFRGSRRDRSANGAVRRFRWDAPVNQMQYGYFNMGVMPNSIVPVFVRAKYLGLLSHFHTVAHSHLYDVPTLSEQQEDYFLNNFCDWESNHKQILLGLDEDVDEDVDDEDNLSDSEHSDE